MKIIDFELILGLKINIIFNSIVNVYKKLIYK